MVQLETMRLKLLNGMSFLLSGQLLHSWHPSMTLLIGIFSRWNGCFPRRSHRGLKSCKLFILMIGYLKKKDTTLLVCSLNPVTALNTFITHPLNPKLEDASFFASNISPLSLHMTTPITSASFMSFLSNCKLKRVRRTNYIPHNYLWNKKRLGGGNSQHGGG